MAKKILAVVLAVMMAVSAMAVTAFADQRIDLYKAASTNTKTVTVTFDIPVYGMYGYLTAGDYMKVYLPTHFGGNANVFGDIHWSVIINGVSYAMKTTPNESDWSNNRPVVEHTIVLGYLGHNYDGKDTAIPQSIGYNTINSFRIVGEMSSTSATYHNADVSGILPNYDSNSYYNQDPAHKVRAQWYKADGTEVNGSISYGESWNPQVSDSSSSKDHTYDFVTNEWTTNGWSSESYVPLTWDHNLTNRAIVYGADTAELVVELAKPIVGQATYTLYANSVDPTNGFDGYNYYPSNYNNLWWNYNSTRKFVDAQTVDGSVTELRFKVDPSFLYDGDGYGTYNRQFVIFENITLFQPSIMKNYLDVDRNLAGGSGTLGRISWQQYTSTGERVLLDGKPLNYARTGMAGVGAVTGNKAWPTDKALTSTTFTVKASNDNYINNLDGTTDGASIDKTKITKDTTVVITTSGIPAGSNWGEYGWGFNPWHGLDLGNNNVNVVTHNDGSKSITGDHLLNANGEGLMSFFSNPPRNVDVTVTVAVYNTADIAGCGDPQYTVDGKLYANDGADVTATAIYLNFPEPEATEPAPDETVTTPTEETDQAADDEQVDVGDVEEPAETTPAPAEQNPPTGLVLAVVPMLVAAAAAVVAKKH